MVVACGEVSHVAVAALVDLVRRAGVPGENITVLMAAMSQATRRIHLPGISIVHHHPDEAGALGHLGYLEGVALEVNARALEADVLIAVGARHPGAPPWHPQGALAALCPGLVGAATAAELQTPDRLEELVFARPEALAYRLPREVARRLGVAFSVEIVEGDAPAVFAGFPELADQAAAGEVMVRRALRVSHPQYDRLVVRAAASDVFDAVPLIAHLTLHRDAMLSKGAPIILEAQVPAPDGARETFYDLLAIEPAPDTLLQLFARRSLRDEGEVRAWAWSRVRTQHPLILVCPSEDEPRARALGATPASSLREAHEIADSLAGPGLTLALRGVDIVSPIYEPRDAHEDEWESVINDL